MEGRKEDIRKLQYSLLPPFALEEVVKVLTFGAKKYDAENWRKVPDAVRRYTDASMRHGEAFRKGEVLDKESGIHHLAHRVCCDLFRLELLLLENASREIHPPYGVCRDLFPLDPPQLDESASREEAE
jgi:hypothetical protein